MSYGDFDPNLDGIRSAVMSQTPVVGAATITGSAVEAKVGASALSKRVGLKIAKIGDGKVYWGGTAAVTTSTGFPLFAENDVYEFKFVPGKYIPIYIISTGSVEVRISEW